MEYLSKRYIVRHTLPWVDRGILRRMWEQRFFLIVLKAAEYQQGKYLSVEEYAKARASGMPFNIVMSDMFLNWNLINIFLVSFGLTKVKTIKDMVGNPEYKGIRAKHTTIYGVDFFEKMNGIIERCKKNGLIKLSTQSNTKDYIKIEREGERFIKFSPFYNALLGEYGYMESFLFGGGGVAVVWLFIHFWSVV